MLVIRETDGRGSGKSRSFDGLTKKSQKQQYLRGLAHPAGANGQHRAQVCPAVAPGEPITLSLAEQRARGMEQELQGGWAGGRDKWVTV